MPLLKAVELGCPGHFVAVASCWYRRHTQVGELYRVSTIGEYHPRETGTRQTVGADPKAFFETMVFKTDGTPERGSEGCGCLHISELSGLEQVRYATAGEAQAGHEAMVQKYREMTS